MTCFSGALVSFVVFTTTIISQRALGLRKSVLTSTIQTTGSDSFCVADNSNDDKFEGEKEPPLFIEATLRFLKIIHSTDLDLSLKYNLILYGGNKSSLEILRNSQSYSTHWPKLSRSKFSYNQNQLIAPTIAAMNQNKSFRGVLATCLTSFHTEHKIVLFIQPESVEQSINILNEINAFYKEHPSKVYSIYFFISWPTSSSWQHEFEFNLKNLQGVLKNSLVASSVDSHLYIHIDRPTDEEDKGRIFSKNSASEEVLWDFYCINQKCIFAPIQLSALSFYGHVNRRKNFKGATVRALVHKSAYVAIFTFMEMNETLAFKRLSYVLLHQISDALNMKLEILDAAGWITEELNGGLAGMGKQLLNDDADISMSISELLSYRIQQLAASHPVTEFPINVYFKQPSPGLCRNIIFQAFSPRLWVVMLVTWLTIVACLICFSFMKKQHQLDDPNSGYSESDEMISADAVSWAIGAACQTGWHYTPSSVSLKIIIICGLVSGVIYYTAYSASIVSMFSVSPNAFQSLADLLHQGFKLYGNEESLSGHYYISKQAKNDGEPFNTRLIDAASALEKIQGTQSAYVVNRENFFSQAVEHNYSYLDFCGFVTKLPQPIGRPYNVWYFRKFDPLRKYVNLQVSRWRECGLLFRMNLELARTLPSPCDPQKRKVIPLELQDVRSAFFIFLAGFIGSAGILAIEIIIRKKQKLKQHRRFSVLFECQVEPNIRRYSA